MNENESKTTQNGQRSLEVGKLAMFRLRMQDKWFDDIVDNNALREQEANGGDEEDDD